MSVPSTPKTPKTPKLKPSNSGITPSSSSIAAKKVIKKAKMMKQLDLKGKFAKQVNKKFATEEEMVEARRQVEQLRLTKMAARLVEKEKIKEERTRKLMEQKEQRRMEKRKKLEWMKPREDLLCEDSKVSSHNYATCSLMLVSLLASSFIISAGY